MLRIALSVLFTAAFCVSNETKILELLPKAYEECGKISNLNKEGFFDALINNNSDDKVKDHSLCFITIIKLVDENGGFNKEQFKKNLQEAHPELADEIYNKCVLEKSDIRETAYSVTKCVAEILSRNN